MPDQAHVRIRLATPDDAAALRDVERRTPTVIGDVAISVDRGEDWFAPVRVMEDPVVLVAEVRDEVAGVFCGARHRARIGGEERWMLFVNQARVIPELQGRGIGSQFVAELVSRYEGKFSDSAYWYIPRAAASSQRFSEVALNKWEAGPYRATITATATSATIGDEAGRPAAVEDDGHIVDILNACHGEEEMYLPYTRESLGERLTRDPRIYSRSHLLVGDAAVVGVWGAPVEVTTWRGDTREAAVEATVMDYGCIPGAEDELDRLLRAAFARQQSKGVSRLSMYCAEGCATSPVVEGLATERIDLDVWTPGVEEPSASAAHGFYVDPLYA